jgi:hypothetical protein
MEAKMDFGDFDWDFLKPVLAGIIRHSLTTVGGALVAQGVIQSSDENALVGAAMAVLAVAWSWWNKVGQKRLMDDLKSGKQ